MSHLTRQDGDLHHEDGSHRSTSPTASGHALELHEARIHAHLKAHETASKLEDGDEPRPGNYMNEVKPGGLD